MINAERNSQCMVIKQDGNITPKQSTEKLQRKECNDKMKQRVKKYYIKKSGVISNA